MADTLPNWRKGVTPHQDIQQNRVSESLFAVNLSRAIAKEGTDQYHDPTLFFERTHLTRTLKSLIRDTLRVLNGEPDVNSVIHLQTNFGGGKTHAELALYHLLKTPQAVSAVPQVAAFLANNGLTVIPSAEVAALPCADLYPGGREVEDGLMIHTLWGEIAYRLGGAALYQHIRASDEARTAPGVLLLRDVLAKAGPNLLLIDELLHYVDKAAGVKVGESNLETQTVGFIRELTEAVDSVPHSILVASLTASRLESLEVFSQDDAKFALSQLEDNMRRIEDARAPIESSEIYEIIRTRLFQQVDESLAAEAAATYAQFYRSDTWQDLLPHEIREAGYEQLLQKSYPFHPAIIRVLYERWGSRPQFQLTRGTLRFLSHLLAHLWQTAPDSQAVSPFIHLGDVDLGSEKVRAEAVQVAGSEWEAVIGADIAPAHAEGISLAQRLDRERGGLYQTYRLAQAVATSVFMFTHGGQQEKTTPHADIRLAVTNPAIPLSDLHQTFDDCKARLYHYYDEEGGCVFKTEPNPNKVLADQRANIHTDDARLKVEEVIPDEIGRMSTVFNLTFYDFKDKKAQEPGDVPDDGNLHMVILPPRHTLSRGQASGRTAAVINDVAANYGKKYRQNRNMVLFMAPDSSEISSAIDQAMNWLAALNVLNDADLMARFSETQREVIENRRVGAQNETRSFVRKAYNTVLVPDAPGSWEKVELNYVPGGKKVIDQAEQDLTQSRKLHSQFNPALFENRWIALWPQTATIISTAALWEKFARQADSPILTNIRVLQETIRKGVEQEIFGYGILKDSGQDKLKAGTYEQVWLGPFDAQELHTPEISQRAVLLRPAQVEALFPAITKEEVAMLLHGPRQSVQNVFYTARDGYKKLTVQGRVDKNAFFKAIFEGVQAGLFGYAESVNNPVLSGREAELAMENIHFSGLLIGDDVPLPVTPDEVAKLVPTTGRVAVQDLYQRAIDIYGAERAAETNVLSALQRCLNDNRFGYAATETSLIQGGAQIVDIDGYLGKPELPPPDTRLIHLSGTLSAANKLAKVVQTVMNMAKLGKSTLKVDITVELKGEVNEHSVGMALNELQKNLPELDIEDVKGA